MPTIVVPLKDIVIDPMLRFDLSTVSEREAIASIKKNYGFLSSVIDVEIQGELAVITYFDAKAQKVSETLKLYSRAVGKAERGEYVPAVELFKKVIEELPYHTDALRNLAMAYQELGHTEQAVDLLIDVLRLNPKDVWGYLLLGNIFAKNKHDLETAERYYQRALEVSKDDPITLANYAALLAEKGETLRARELYTQVISANPQYPNSYLGLAHMELQESHLRNALSALELLYEQPRSKDPRSIPVYQHGRTLYRETCERVAREEHERIDAAVQERKALIEKEGDVPIEVTEDTSLRMVTARTQMAWRHSQSMHRVSYKAQAEEILPHILSHELEHIKLELEARRIGRNKTFAASAVNNEHAHRSIAEDLPKLQRGGYSGELIAQLTNDMVQGLTNQLYNCPLDMFVEFRLREGFRELWPVQVLSLLRTNAENSQVLTNREIQRITPRKIYRANLAMNSAFACCIDWLTHGATDCSGAFSASSEYATGKRLFESWLEAKDKFEPGDEYHLINEFARILGLQDWYTLIEDDPQRNAYSPKGPTNPDLLKEKNSAAMMYCLGALERFSGMSDDAVRKVGFEIAMLGMHGIDYASSDQKYSLSSLPDSKFSGLQLLAYMYVAFQRIDPSVDAGVDLKEPYELALKMYRGGRA